ncbi:MAG: peroxiredoxin, partial [Syntrophobacteraceae bacterium]|nr:peroxiredoxin [Syntrophobacteraceae bacterium]
RKYVILRSSGTSERALFLIDKKGVLRFMDIHDINEMPSIESLVGEMEKLRQ